MGKVNILIADFNNSCAFFVKSVMQPQGYGISLAFNAREMEAKLGTGLFDVLLASMDLETVETHKQLRGVNKLLPGMPVILISGEGHPGVLPGIDIHSHIERPITISKLSDTLGEVRRCITAWDNRRRHPRRQVNFPAEINAGGRTVFCRATNLSSGGMQVESADRARVRKGLEALFRANDRGPILARLFLGNRKIWEFQTEVAYVERYQTRSPEQVGLAFTAMPDRQKVELEKFLVELG